MRRTFIVVLIVILQVTLYGLLPFIQFLSVAMFLVFVLPVFIIFKKFDETQFASAATKPIKQATAHITGEHVTMRTCAYEYG